MRRRRRRRRRRWAWWWGWNIWSLADVGMQVFFVSSD
jgi:hypothetical protein